MRKGFLVAGLGLLVGFATLARATPARAEASAWAFVGGGAVGFRSVEAPAFYPTGTMIIDGGVGSSPDGPVIIGGVFRFQPVFPNGGIDISLLARLATHGFQAGDWGVAIDAGFYGRPWGYWSTGFAGSVSIGMPLGITLMLQGDYGTVKSATLGAVAGIDLLRLTVYRQTLLKWWQNPRPAYSQTASSGPGLSF